MDRINVSSTRNRMILAVLVLLTISAYGILHADEGGLTTAVFFVG